MTGEHLQCTRACQLAKHYVASASIRRKLDGLRLPRPREFEEGIAIEAAMQRFWAAGYAATSVRDLGDAMGLGPASVYNAFGDKTDALHRSASTATWMPICVPALPASKRPCRLASRSKPFLAEIVERSLESRLGCLLVNSALEVAPHDPGIADIVAARIGELEAFFRRCVIGGERDGSISP